MPTRKPKLLEEEVQKVSFLKEHFGLIASAAGVVTIIVTSVLAVEARYANAADVKEMVRNQGEQIRALNQNNTRSLIFQLEYYDNAIRQRERSIAVPQTPNARRQIDSELEELKMKREIVRKQLIEQK
jgi:hypothetical protein